MNYSTFLGIAEVVWTVLALAGIALGLYLLRAERRDRASLIAENGRTGILSWGLVVNESLRVFGHSLFLVAGGLALATPNPAAPASAVAPALVLLLVLFAALGVAQSSVLIYVRERIARYPLPPPPAEVAQQGTLLEVQRDMATSADVADLALRATASEHRADAAQERADVSERRADAAELREPNDPATR